MKSSPCVCFVAGAGGAAFEWNIWSRVYAAAGYRIIYWNSPPLPHDEIDDEAAALVFQQRVQSLKDLCQRQQVDIIIAASLGGSFSLQVCADRFSTAALVLVAPLVPNALCTVPLGNGRKMWANSSALSNTLNAIPDGHWASNYLAHQHWCDESAAVLRHANRHSARMPEIPTLVILAEYDTDVDNAQIKCFSAGAECWVQDYSSHAGLLIGRHAAELAWRTQQWCALALRSTKASD